MGYAQRRSRSGSGPSQNPALLGALALTVVLQLAAVYVPPFQRILLTTALPARDLLVAFAAGAVVLLSVEVWKWVLRRSAANEVLSMDDLYDLLEGFYPYAAAMLSDTS